MVNKRNHPVWEVYDLHRTCRLNVKYWSAKLVSLRRKNFCLEYILMATAPSSAIAGLVFWNTTYGKSAWSILICVTAIIAVAKPLLKLSDKLEKLQKVVTLYKSVEFQVEALENDIQREDEYSTTMVNTYKNLANQVGEISKDEPTESIDQDLRKSCYKEVNEELPFTHFYEPSK